MPNYISINNKIEDALVSYLASIATAMGFAGLQCVADHQDAELATPRLVVTVNDVGENSISLPGVMNVGVAVAYITQSEVTAATHKTNAGTIQSWLFDVAAVKAAVNASGDLHCYLYQLGSAKFEADADAGTHTTTTDLSLVAMGQSI